MKFSVKFLWFDFWVGGFWDRQKRVLYVCPLPCVVLKFDFSRPKLEWVSDANKAFHEMVEKAGPLPSSFLCAPFAELSDEDLEEACMDDEDPAAVEEFYARQLNAVRGERDAMKVELERIKSNLGLNDTAPFCPQPGCPSHNPRT